MEREGKEEGSLAAVGVDRWEAGFGCEDRGGGREKVVCDPSADPMPERVH